MAMQDYCSLRMVGEYEKRFYLPIAKRFQELTENNGVLAKKLSIQNDRIHSLWKDIRIDMPVQDRKGPYRIGDTFQVTADIQLGQLRPEEVDVELYTGNLRSMDSLDDHSYRTHDRTGKQWRRLLQLCLFHDMQRVGTLRVHGQDYPARR